MDGKQPAPALGTNPPAGAAGAHAESLTESEVFGVLELSRRSKDDGRALLVFRRSLEPT